MRLDQIKSHADAVTYFENRHAQLTQEIVARLDWAALYVEARDAAGAKRELAAVAVLQDQKAQIEALWIITGSSESKS